MVRHNCKVLILNFLRFIVNIKAIYEKAKHDFEKTNMISYHTLDTAIKVNAFLESYESTHHCFAVLQKRFVIFIIVKKYMINITINKFNIFITL